MSRFSTMAATSHTLSLTAMEEASRLGQRTADIDHLFLALVVSEQVAGQVLRGLGITLAGARDAVLAQHAEQLATLGVRSEIPRPGRITFHETDGYECSQRAIDVIERSTDGKQKGDATAVLRALVAEPSGLIEAILRRLGTEPDAVTAELDEIERVPLPPQHSSDPGALSGTTCSFAPAPPDLVWGLLADPARMPEWEPGTGTVADPPSEIAVGSAWTAHAPTHRPDGKPSKIKAAYRVARVEVTEYRQGELIEWYFFWPNAPRSNSRRLRIELEPAAGGSQLRISTTWVRDRTPLRSFLSPLRWLFRPLHRFAIWLQLAQLSGAISRVFR